jgi:hypothetical protein
MESTIEQTPLTPAATLPQGDALALEQERTTQATEAARRAEAELKLQQPSRPKSRTEALERGARCPPGKQAEVLAERGD